MKTSNLILTVFLSLTVLFMLSLLIQVTPEKLEPKMEKQSVDLPSFKHLVLDNCPVVELKQAQTNSAQTHFSPGSKASMPEFELKNDSLIVTWDDEDKNWGKAIFCSGLRSITVKQSKLRIDSMLVDSLSIWSANSNLSLYATQGLNYLQMDLNQKSLCRVDGKRVKVIEVKADNSNLEFNIDIIEELKARLEHNSSMKTKKVARIRVEADESSRYYSK